MAMMPPLRHKTCVLLTGAGIALAAAVVLGAMLLVTTTERVMLRRDVEGFAQTEGVVLHARLRRTSMGRAIPDIRFEFTVDGRRIEGTNRGATDAMATNEAHEALRGLG